MFSHSCMFYMWFLWSHTTARSCLGRRCCLGGDIKGKPFSRVPRTANIQRGGMLPKKPPRRAACWVMGITKLQKPALFEGQVCGTSDLFKIEWPSIQTAAWEKTLSTDSAFPEYVLGQERLAPLGSEISFQLPTKDFKIFNRPCL